MTYDEFVFNQAIRQTKTDMISVGKRLADRGYELNAKMSRKEPGEDGESGSVMQTMLEQSKNISVLSHTSFDMRA